MLMHGGKFLAVTFYLLFYVYVVYDNTVTTVGHMD